MLKDHKEVTPVRLETAALRSQVKHSTTEPLRSQPNVCLSRHIYLAKQIMISSSKITLNMLINIILDILLNDSP